MDLDTAAYACGWFGWSQGRDPYIVYVCDLDKCGKHTLYVSTEAIRDPDYYAIHCAFIRACCNPPNSPKP